MNLYASGEDYLEAILVLYKKIWKRPLGRHRSTYGSIK